MRLKLVPSDTSIDFLRHRRVAFIFSLVLVLVVVQVEIIMYTLEGMLVVK